METRPAARSEKIFCGLVWHHHSLKIYFVLRKHTVMPQFGHLCIQKYIIGYLVQRKFLRKEILLKISLTKEWDKSFHMST